MATRSSTPFSVSVQAAGSAPVWPVQDPVGYLPAVRNRNGAGQPVAAGRGFAMGNRHAYVQAAVGATTTGVVPQVLHVTTRANSGPGSLREHLTNVSGPRIIVFDVGGRIALSGSLTIFDGDVWIAGQTAPSQVIIDKTGPGEPILGQGPQRLYSAHRVLAQRTPGISRSGCGQQRQRILR